MKHLGFCAPNWTGFLHQHFTLVAQMYHTKHTTLTSTHPTPAVIHMGTASTKKTVIKPIPHLMRSPFQHQCSQHTGWTCCYRVCPRPLAHEYCSLVQQSRSSKERGIAENLQQNLLREVGEGGGAGLGEALLLEIGGGVLLCQQGVGGRM